MRRRGPTKPQGWHHLEILSAGLSSAAAPRLSLREQAGTLQSGLMTDQPSSLQSSSGVIYHADSDKEKRNLRRKATAFSSMEKPRFYLRLNCTTQRSRLVGLSRRRIQSCSLPAKHFCHLMTLSALASTSGGIIRPICFAVLRLMTSSNFIGCSTGM